MSTLRLNHAKMLEVLICWSIPIDGLATSSCCCGVPGLCNEIMLDIVEEAIVVIFDPAGESNAM